MITYRCDGCGAALEKRQDLAWRIERVFGDYVFGEKRSWDCCTVECARGIFEYL